ncbi:MAG TPA: Crp/Fnr family transcriptional regulator [Woeseiaceae bacterium]|jgi:CRP/FNR family transcriptional regulator
MDAMVDDRFAETLDSRHLVAHEVLRNYGFYINSDAEQRLELLEAANPLKAANGQPLQEAGYACREVVLVGRGRIRIFIAGETGREVTLYYVKAGESCPVNLGAAIMGIGAFADAAASGELAALTISAQDIREISQRNAALQDYIFSATVLRFGEVIRLVREITTRRVDHRLAEYLLRKFEESEDSPPAAEVTQQNIALELGTAREVVSRRLQELDSIGAVELGRGRIILQDRLALHRIIDQKGAA